jgi:hypothetical protein
VATALRRTLPPRELSEKGLDSIMEGLEQEAIEQIVLIAFDSDGKARGQLSISIDWIKHHVHVKAGRATVTIDDRWIDRTAPELHYALNVFNRYAKAKALHVEWRVRYRPRVDVDAMDQTLGLVAARPVQWFGVEEGVEWAEASNSVPELDEMTVELRVVE